MTCGTSSGSSRKARTRRPSKLLGRKRKLARPTKRLRPRLATPVARLPPVPRLRPSSQEIDCPWEPEPDESVQVPRFAVHRVRAAVSQVGR